MYCTSPVDVPHTLEELFAVITKLIETFRPSFGLYNTEGLVVSCESIPYFSKVSGLSEKEIKCLLNYLDNNKQSILDDFEALQIDYVLTYDSNAGVGSSFDLLFDSRPANEPRVSKCITTFKAISSDSNPFVIIEDKQCVKWNMVVLLKMIYQSWMKKLTTGLIALCPICI